MMRKLLFIAGLLWLVGITANAYTIDDFVTDFEWLEPNNTVEIAVGETHQLKYTCTQNYSKVFSKEMADNFVHYDYTGNSRHVVDQPEGYSIDENGNITGLVVGTYEIKPTGLIQSKNYDNRNLIINVVSEHQEKEPNNTMDTANEFTSKIRCGLYNTSDIDFFKVKNTFKWGERAKFIIHMNGIEGIPNGYKWAGSSGTAMDRGGSILSNEQECSILTTGEDYLYFEIYFDQSRSQYFQYTDNIVIELYDESKVVKVSSISLDKSQATISVGESLTLSPTISPSNATNKSLEWSSSNSSIASVADGVVTGVSAGEATITAKSTDGSNVNASCVITVSGSSKSGKCGDNATWELGDDGTLTISGSGEMTNYVTTGTDINGYQRYSNRPWNNYVNEIKRVVLKDGITRIGKGAFYRCQNIKEIELSNSLVEIGYDAFSECTTITEIIIPSSVKTISGFAFHRNSAASKLVIPSSVTTIGENAFNVCTSLSAIYCYLDKPINIVKSVFDNIDKAKCILYVPEGCSNTYKTTNVWKEFSHIVEMNHYEITDDINKYSDRIFKEVYNLADSSWYMLNSEKQYEKYGILEKVPVKYKWQKLTSSIADDSENSTDFNHYIGFTKLRITPDNVDKEGKIYILDKQVADNVGSPYYITTGKSKSFSLTRMFPGRQHYTQSYTYDVTTASEFTKEGQSYEYTFDQTMYFNGVDTKEARISSIEVLVPCFDDITTYEGKCVLMGDSLFKYQEGLWRSKGLFKNGWLPLTNDMDTTLLISSMRINYSENIGYGVCWHAFANENGQEMMLSVWDEAFTLTSSIFSRRYYIRDQKKVEGESNTYQINLADFDFQPLHRKWGENNFAYFATQVYLDDYPITYEVKEKPSILRQKITAIDLGLSVKWGSCNIGSESPSDYGNYYQWAGKNPNARGYKASIWPYYDEATETYSKYSYVTKESMNGKPDGKTQLDRIDDVAASRLGECWRMPTKAEYDELVSNCTITWGEENGVAGCKVVAKNGNSIFIPASGYSAYSEVPISQGSLVELWTSNLTLINNEQSYAYHFSSSGSYSQGRGRFDVLAIRPVYDENNANVSHETEKGVSKKEIVESNGELEIDDTDKSFAVLKEAESVNITYRRDFDLNHTWQAWFMPFETTFSELNKYFDVAEIQGVMFDAKNEPCITFRKMSGGTVKANVPYVVRPIYNEGTTVQVTGSLRKTDNISTFAIQSATNNFTFGGVLSRKPVDQQGWYAINESGHFEKMESGTDINTFRIYMDISDRQDAPYSVFKPGNEVKCMIIGEDDVTGIDERRVTSDERESLVNLAGQAVREDFKGIVIKNSKKYLVK